MVVLVVIMEDLEGIKVGTEVIKGGSAITTEALAETIFHQIKETITTCRLECQNRHKAQSMIQTLTASRRPNAQQTSALNSILPKTSNLQNSFQNLTFQQPKVT